MAIETLDDIIEDLADKLGIYGACRECVEESYCEENRCRVCFTSGLKSRLTMALDIETKIATMERILRESR